MPVWYFNNNNSNNPNITLRAWTALSLYNIISFYKIYVLLTPSFQNLKSIHNLNLSYLKTCLHNSYKGSNFVTVIYSMIFMLQELYLYNVTPFSRFISSGFIYECISCGNSVKLCVCSLNHFILLRIIINNLYDYFLH